MRKMQMPKKGKVVKGKGKPPMLRKKPGGMGKGAKDAFADKFKKGTHEDRANTIEDILGDGPI